MEEEKLRHIVTRLAATNPDVPNIQFIRDDPSSVRLSLLGAGSCNYVIRVASQDGQQSVIVKHAPLTLKSFAQIDAPQERAHVDYYCLQRWHQICPGSVPIPYCLDTNLHAFAMEDLGEMRNLSEDLNQGVVDLGVARHVATVMGRVHEATWGENMSQADWEKLAQEVNEANKLEGVVLDTFLKLKEEGVLAKHMRRMEERFSNMQCLIHNDLHSSSVMKKGDQIRILDMEFSCLSVAGFDVGYIINSYMICYYRHAALGNIDISARFIEAIKTILETYLEIMGPTLEKHAARENVMSDIAAYTAWAAYRLPIFSDIDFHFMLTPAMTVTLLDVAMRGFDKYPTVHTVSDFMDVFIP